MDTAGIISGVKARGRIGRGSGLQDQQSERYIRTTLPNISGLDPVTTCAGLSGFSADSFRGNYSGLY